MTQSTAIPGSNRIENYDSVHFPESLERARPLGLCPRVNTTSLRIRENSRRDFARRIGSETARREKRR